MPTWGIIAQLAVALMTALVAIAVYRVQADKLFLEFRDKRDQALTAFLEACESRQQAIADISKADMVGLVDPEKYEARNRDVIRTAAVARMWFGKEVARAIAECEAEMMTAHRAKMEWCANPKPNFFSESVIQPHMNAYSAIHRVRLVAGPYLNAGRRGLNAWQRLWVCIRMR